MVDERSVSVRYVIRFFFNEDVQDLSLFFLFFFKNFCRHFYSLTTLFSSVPVRLLVALFGQVLDGCGKSFCVDSGFDDLKVYAIFDNMTMLVGKGSVV